MSTRSTIGIKRSDCTITKIYCHSDGYLEWNGAILQKNYNTAEKVERLLKLGNLSCLGPEIKPDDPADWGIDKTRDSRFCKTYTSRGEEWGQVAPEQMEEYNYLFDEEEAAWIVARETYKKPGKTAKSIGIDAKIYDCYETDYLIDLLAKIPQKSWDGMKPRDENDWGVTLDECMAAAREARDPVNERKRREYDAYYRAYCD